MIASVHVASAFPATKQGVASAVNDTAREVGGAIGIAMLGGLVTTGYQDGGPHLADLPPEGAERAHPDDPAIATAVHEIARDLLARPGRDVPPFVWEVLRRCVASARANDASLAATRAPQSPGDRRRSEVLGV
jgi:hypothetical protein